MITGFSCFFQLTSVSQRRFKQDVEEALNKGNTLIIEGIMEELDPGLEHLISQSFYTAGTKLQVYERYPLALYPVFHVNMSDLKGVII